MTRQRRAATALASLASTYGFAFVITACIAPSPGGHRVQASERDATWSHDIAPLVYKHCTACHHAGGAGPFALMTYADAKRWGGSMESVTASRYMPPWLPEPGYGEFQESRRLPDEDIATIKRWVAAGMPEGDTAAAPKPPAYTSEWQLGTPDLVLEVTSPTTVPAGGTDQFRNFILPAGLLQTRWIRAMEIKPGSPRVVHHANVLLDRTASLRRQHPNDWRDGIPGMDITVDGGPTFDPDSHLLFWKPDSSALIEPPGMPWRLDPGNDLILNMHLKPTGKVEQVKARIGLYFAPGPATKLPILLQLEHDDALDIPAGDAHFVVDDKLTLPEAVEVLAVYPHAHYLGKQMEGYAILPSGQRRWIVFIKDWDIERQAIYRLAKPLLLPKGSTLHMRFTYDNSAANLRNPHTPATHVHAGNRSEDEMGHLWLQVLPAEARHGNEDARVPLERAWMENRLRKDANDSTALYNLAAMDLNANQTAQARALLQRALLHKPNDARLLTAAGMADSRAGNAEAAQREFGSALAADPTYADARFDLAKTDLTRGDFADAEKNFLAYLQTNPGDAAALSGLGAALLAQNRAAEAKSAFDGALAAEPRSFDALYNLAAIAGDANDTPQAVALLRRALAVQQDPDAERLYALAEARLGDVTQAVVHMRNARDLRPADPELHTLLAKLYAQQGKWTDAASEQSAALKLDSSHAEDWSLLGTIEQRGGNEAASRQSFAKALQLDPSNVQAQRALHP